MAEPVENKKEKIKVLAVENNRDLCEVLRVMVTGEPDLHWVGAAYDGIKALDMITETSPDVIILDIIMPYLDGMGVLSRLTELDLPKRPRVIVLTAFEEEGMIHKSAKLGADFYLLKPFDRESLINRIRQVAGTDRERAVIRRKRSLSELGPALESEATLLLYKIGVPTYFKGYLYLRDAIAMVARDIGLLGSITKSLYPRIAEKYGTTPLIVEAAIRYTIQKAWRQGSPEYLNKLFGHAISLKAGKPPTNSFFIARVAEELRMRMTQEP